MKKTTSHFAIILLVAFAPLFPGIASGQDTHLLKSSLLKNGKMTTVYLTTATDSTIKYRTTVRTVKLSSGKRNALDGIFIYEPREFSAAITLYRKGEFAEAKKAFALCRETYQKLALLSDSPSVLAGYYELECLRQLGDLNGLDAARKAYQSEGLRNKEFLRQLEIYPIWNAVRTKDWPQVILLSESWKEKELPGWQRVQVTYCQGLALAAEGKPFPALDAFSIAYTADPIASKDLSQKAVLESLKIYEQNKDVKLALKVADNPDENPNPVGTQLLAEAGALTQTWELIIGQGTPLPKNFTKFKKFAASSAK